MDLTIIMQDESDGELESLDGNKLETVLIALKVRRVQGIKRCCVDGRRG